MGEREQAKSTPAAAAQCFFKPLSEDKGRRMGCVGAAAFFLSRGVSAGLRAARCSQYHPPLD
jgi:hypothetical protein